MYSLLLVVHQICVGLSIVLLLWRVVERVRTQQRLRGWLRGVVHAIDSILLAAGVSLVWLRGMGLSEAWLQYKLLFVGGYIVLAGVGLRHAQTSFGKGVLAIAGLLLAGVLFLVLHRPVWVALF